MPRTHVPPILKYLYELLLILEVVEVVQVLVHDPKHSPEHPFTQVVVHADTHVVEHPEVQPGAHPLEHEAQPPPQLLEQFALVQPPLLLLLPVQLDDVHELPPPPLL